MSKPIKTWKRLALGLGGGGVMLVLVLAIFLLVFNLNAYKQPLQAWVAQHYHRTLTFEGDIKLAVFPHFGVKLPRMVLSQPNRDTAFVSIDHAYVAVALWPLLSRRLVIDQVSMEELKVGAVSPWNLRMHRVDLDTALSVDFPAQKLVAQKTKIVAQGNLHQADRPVGQVGTTLTLQTLNVDLRQAVLKVENLVMQAKGVIAQAPFEFEAQMPAFDPSPTAVTHAPSQGFLRWNGKETGEIRFALTPIRGDRNQLKVDELTLNTVIHQATRTLTLAAVSPLAVNRAPFRGIALPALRGRMTLTDSDSAEAKLQTSYTGSLSANMTQGSAQGHLVGVTLAGNKWDVTTNVTALTRAPVIHFMAAADSLNLDKFVPARKKQKETQTLSESNAANDDVGVAPEMAALGASVTADPPNLLVLMNPTAYGKIKVGHLQVRGVKAENVSTTVKLIKGKLDLSAVSATLYGGKLTGALSLDMPHHTWATQMLIKHVGVGALLADVSKPVWLTGVGTFNAQLASHGENVAIIKKHLAGTVQGQVQNGAVQGVDVGGMLLSFTQAIRQGSPPEKGARATDATYQTGFNRAEAEVTIKEGIAKVVQLNAVSPVLKISQRTPAQIDLCQETLDFRLNVKMLGVLPLPNANRSNGWNITVPMFVTGRYDALTSGIDWRAVVGF